MITKSLKTLEQPMTSTIGNPIPRKNRPLNAHRTNVPRNLSMTTLSAPRSRPRVREVRSNSGQAVSRVMTMTLDVPPPNTTRYDIDGAD